MARRVDVLACKPEDIFLAVSKVEQQLAHKSLMTLGHTARQRVCKNYEVFYSSNFEVQYFFSAEVKRLHDPDFVSRYFKRQLTIYSPLYS